MPTSDFSDTLLAFIYEKIRVKYYPSSLNDMLIIIKNLYLDLIYLNRKSEPQKFPFKQ